MKNLPKVIDGIEFAVNGEVKVSSLQVAEKFDKRHANVMRDIGVLMRRGALNFELAEYEDKQKKLRPMYLMNRDGFSLLAMGFTGEEAFKWKLGFIAAFNKMEQFIIAEIERQKNDDAARLECRPMTQALKDIRIENGKDTKPFHYSNEHSMIYRIVLGATKKQWCELHGIDKKDRFRDYMPTAIIAAIADIQRVNTDLIEMGLEYKERKVKLNDLYTRRHLQKCLDQIDMLEE